LLISMCVCVCVCGVAMVTLFTAWCSKNGTVMMAEACWVM